MCVGFLQTLPEHQFTTSQFRPWRKPDAGNEAWSEGGRGPGFWSHRRHLLSRSSTGLSGHSEWTLDPTGTYGRTSEWTETANSKHWFTTSSVPLQSWRKMPESDAQSVTLKTGRSLIPTGTNTQCRNEER